MKGRLLPDAVYVCSAKLFSIVDELNCVQQCNYLLTQINDSNPFAIFYRSFSAFSLQRNSGINSNHKIILNLGIVIIFV